MKDTPVVEPFCRRCRCGHFFVLLTSFSNAFLFFSVCVWATEVIFGFQVLSKAEKKKKGNRGTTVPLGCLTFKYRGIAVVFVVISNCVARDAFHTRFSFFTLFLSLAFLITIMKEVTALTSIEYSQARFLFLVRKVFLFFWLVPSLKGRLATQKKKKKIYCSQFAVTSLWSNM